MFIFIMNNKSIVINGGEQLLDLICRERWEGVLVYCRLCNSMVNEGVKHFIGRCPLQGESIDWNGSEVEKF